MPGPGMGFISVEDFMAAKAAQLVMPATLDPEAAIMRLREAAERYAEADVGPRFAVGHLVTPVKDGPVKGHGDPHLVIAMRDHAEPDFHSPRLHGERNDIRVLALTEGVIFPHWGESAHYEAYTGPGA